MNRILEQIEKITDDYDEIEFHRDNLRNKLEAKIFNTPNLTPRQKQRRREKYNKQTSGGKYPELYRG